MVGLDRGMHILLVVVCAKLDAKEKLGLKTDRVNFKENSWAKIEEFQLF